MNWDGTGNTAVYGGTPNLVGLGFNGNQNAYWFDDYCGTPTLFAVPFSSSTPVRYTYTLSSEGNLKGLMGGIANDGQFLAYLTVAPSLSSGDNFKIFVVSPSDGTQSPSYSEVTDVFQFTWAVNGAYLVNYGIAVCDQASTRYYNLREFGSWLNSG